MDSLLTGATVASIVITIFMIVVVTKLGRTRALSIARVEALQALVAEPTPAFLRPASDDDWDLALGQRAREASDHSVPVATPARVALRVDAPSGPLDGLVAVVYLIDKEGRVVGSGHASIEAAN